METMPCLSRMCTWARFEYQHTQQQLWVDCLMVTCDWYWLMFKLFSDIAEPIKKTNWWYIWTPITLSRYGIELHSVCLTQYSWLWQWPSTRLITGYRSLLSLNQIWIWSWNGYIPFTHCFFTLTTFFLVSQCHINWTTRWLSTILSGRSYKNFIHSKM